MPLKLLGKKEQANLQIISWKEIINIEAEVREVKTKKITKNQ
jgi:hypothetical protein